MLASYNHKSNMAALVLLVSMLGALAAISGSGKNLWDATPFGPVLGVVWVASYFYALWCWIKGKGRDGAWILVAFLNVLGVIILLCLKDYHKDGKEAQRDEVTPPEKLRTGWTSDL